MTAIKLLSALLVVWLATVIGLAVTMDGTARGASSLALVRLVAGGQIVHAAVTQYRPGRLYWRVAVASGV
jgi:hypothetical protein